MCGTELADDAAVCFSCGSSFETALDPVSPVYGQKKQNSGLTTTAKVFMVIGAIVTGLMGYTIPLAWCIPMTIIYFNKVKNGQHISTGFKVCTLIFVSTIAGILMLCDKDN